MKTAILISGHMRSFERCLPNQAWMVYRHFHDADFYVSTEPDEDSEKADLLRARFPHASVMIDRTPQPDMAPFIPSGHPWAHAPWSISVPPAAVVGQLWRLQQAWRMMDLLENYDHVIRCRPDIWFHSAYDIGPPLRGVVRVPWWGSFGGINDRFAIMAANTASDYFGAFSAVPELLEKGCPLHPESLLAASITRAGWRIDPTLDAEFSTLRTDGTGRLPEITTGEIGRFARTG